MSNRFRPTLVGAVLAVAAIVSGCQNVTPSDTSYHNPAEDDPNAPKQGSILSDLNPFSSGGESPGQIPAGASNAIGVNTFLWRASLDTVSFMPVASADPFGGVIITDWYAPPETPGERFKVNVFILDRQLRSDSIRAAVFRQTQSTDGRWVDAPVDEKTAANFENAILTRARQLRIASVKPQ